MPRLSILIPCFDPAAELEDTLVSVLQNRPRNCEVLVVHTQQYSDPYNLRDEVQLLRVSGRVSICQLANSGLAAASGDVVHLLLPGMTATEGWTDDVLPHFDDPEVACVAPLVVDASDSQKIASAGLQRGLLSVRKVNGAGAAVSLAQPRRWNVMGPTLAAGFYRRSVLESLGGLSTQLADDLADIDLAESIQALGLLSLLEPKSRLIQQQGKSASKASLLQGKSRELVFWRHAERRSLVSKLMHPLEVLMELAHSLAGEGSAFSQLMGRMAGAASFGVQSSHRKRLIEATEMLAEMARQASPETLSISAARREKAGAESASQSRRAA